MAFTDVFLVLIIAISVYNGWRKGFILGMLELLTWAGSFLLALYLYQYVAGWLQSLMGGGIWLLPISLLATLLIVRIVAAFISNAILKEVPASAHQAQSNRVLGVIPGFVNGCVYAVLIGIILLLMPLSDSITADIQKSRLADRASGLGEWLQQKMQPVYEKFARNPVRVTQTAEHGEMIKLPFKVTAPKVRQDLEVKMLELVNQERVKEGLKPLEADPEVAVVARAHSVDMFARGYFSHITPEGKDPFDRLNKAGINFLTAGENLALAPTLAQAHEGLLKSPGHRANILHKAFGRVGIGVLDGGMRGLMITQNFRN
jgi:uncharacterized protein YkwD